jgi:hypothetical protein
MVRYWHVGISASSSVVDNDDGFGHYDIVGIDSCICGFGFGFGFSSSSSSHVIFVLRRGGLRIPPLSPRLCLPAKVHFGS